MLLLPVAGSLGVVVIPEIILVLRPGQPCPHELALPSLAAVGFEAVALALSTPVVGKKKFLAVQALASGLRRLHRFQNKKEPVSETGAEERKKIQPQEKSEPRRRKKNFQRICRRKSTGRRSHSKPPILHPFDFARGKQVSPPAATLPRKSAQQVSNANRRKSANLPSPSDNSPR